VKIIVLQNILKKINKNMNNNNNQLDHKGGNPQGLLIIEMMKLPIWKLNIVIILLKIHLTFIVKFYLKH